MTSYEVGLKTELFHRRVRFNVAGYYNVYKDLAVNVPVPDAPQGTFSTRIANAGKVNYAGFEAELQAILTDNFSIDGAIGYVNVDYKEFLGASRLSRALRPSTSHRSLFLRIPRHGQATSPSMRSSLSVQAVRVSSGGSAIPTKTASTAFPRRFPLPSTTPSRVTIAT
ncbi:TonB-dependent receptor domain-containing protein [Novosphingobium panipatense]